MKIQNAFDGPHDIRRVFFFVSPIFASRIPGILDLKKVLVVSLRAEYTRFGESKNTLSTRGTLNR